MTPSATDAPVVVGVDGTPTGLHAVAWAAAEAAARGCALVIAHAARYTGGEQGNRRAAGILGRARAIARAEFPQLVVETRLVDDDPLPGLLDAAEDARLLVTGLMSGTIADAVLGSLALDVLGRASCPVAVVRRPDRFEGTSVVAGVDGSRADAAVVSAAFAAASAHRLPLRLVHVGHRHDALTGPVRDDELARWSGPYPGVEVSVETVQGHPTEVLAERSTGARVLVVGTRRAHRPARLLFGSTSRSLAWNSRCPLLVTPAVRSVPPNLERVGGLAARPRS
ncbi:universal stress protein [Pseudonocardia dioxanivorans]|uniref:universal stress protein n=1 Tax=Pseudonocardia dioxanivorans TaxID=240495 RepID=UPI000CD04F78|nr:universal stress protein [Pseudonocardia dioxanivorans]